ncbi:hypothetical protein [Shouchella oshimensis]|uniref:Uncharacterized protein n=1 Tax=Alkalicoccobacillus plakortidis TaxID=444060 RepID=A0A9D5DPV8_9BACI|nr:hypothetical protein [Shouchella oshimensis]KQL56896.1 hypothetical protein AN965_11675 [Alkalicoccobacillus plakortidis]
MKNFLRRLLKVLFWTVIFTIVPMYVVFLAADIYEVYVLTKQGGNALFWTYVFGTMGLMVTIPLATLSYLLVVFFEWKDGDKKTKRY